MTTRPITTRQVERALAYIAHVVASPGGEVYVELFERLERELADRQRKTDAVARARALVADSERRTV